MILLPRRFLTAGSATLAVKDFTSIEYATKARISRLYCADKRWNKNVLLTIVELEVMQHFQSCFFNTCQLIINYMRLFLNNIFMMIWYCLHLTVQFRLIVLTNFKSLTKHGAFDFFLHPSFDDNLLLKGSIIDLHLIVIEYSTSMELVPYE